MFDGLVRMLDRRLIGTWRSDRRRTAEDVNARRDLSPTQRKNLVAVFGQLTLRYSARRVYVTYRGDSYSHPYRVVAKDSDSVVVVSPSDFSEDDDIFHIHFEGHRYWVCLGAVREFFRKVPTPSAKPLAVKHK